MAPPHSTRSAVRGRVLLGCFFFPFALLFGLCGVSLTFLASSVATDWVGITDFYKSAPRLPSFARTADTTQLENSEVACYNNNGFNGPYIRHLVFGTDGSFDYVVGRLLPEFERRHWSVKQGADFLYVSSAENDLRIHYSLEDAESPFVGDADLRRRAADFRTVIVVSVEDSCPP